MKRAIFCAMLIAISSIWITACSVLDSIQNAAVSSVDSGSVLFYDEFSDPTSGWRTWQTDTTWIGYQNDGFRFYIADPNFDYWSVAGKRFNDVTLAVDAAVLAGPTNNDFGVICRYQDELNFYAFLISADGYGGIVRMQEGVYQVLQAEVLEYSPVIQQGYTTNHLRADCIGSKLALYVNQEKVFEVEDAAFTHGDVGLMAGSYQEAGVDVFFDNFFVIKP